jgi:phage-related protein
MYDAKPLIRAYGTGYFSISGIRVNINSANVYTDIDCELQEAYKGTINCNGNITLVNGEFPILKSGENLIVISGLSKIELTPRWWTI